MPDLIITSLATVATPAPGIDPVHFHYPERHILVRELIALAVREQCALLAQQHAGTPAQAQQIMARQFLSAGEVAAQAALGAVKVQCAVPAAALRLDPDLEIARALAAFEAGAFLVLVGSLRCTSLEQSVLLELAQPVRFVRMIALTGG